MQVSDQKRVLFVDFQTGKRDKQKYFDDEHVDPSAPNYAYTHWTLSWNAAGRRYGIQEIGKPRTQQRNDPIDWKSIELVVLYDFVNADPDTKAADPGIDDALAPHILDKIPSFQELLPRLQPDYAFLRKWYFDLVEFKESKTEPKFTMNSVDPKELIPWLLTSKDAPPVVFAAQLSTSFYTEDWLSDDERWPEERVSALKHTYTLHPFDYIKPRDATEQLRNALMSKILNGITAYLFIAPNTRSVPAATFNKQSAKWMFAETRAVREAAKRKARAVLVPDYMNISTKQKGIMNIMDEYFGHRWDNNPLMFACAYKFPK